MKDHPFERRERYEFMIDYCSYVHSSCEIKAWTEKNSGLIGISNPWSLRYPCSALPTELSSHLGAEPIVSS